MIRPEGNSSQFRIYARSSEDHIRPENRGLHLPQELRSVRDGSSINESYVDHVNLGRISLLQMRCRGGRAGSCLGDMHEHIFRHVRHDCSSAKRDVQFLQILCIDRTRTPSEGQGSGSENGQGQVFRLVEHGLSSPRKRVMRSTCRANRPGSLRRLPESCTWVAADVLSRRQSTDAGRGLITAAPYSGCADALVRCRRKVPDRTIRAAARLAR